jgi:hypothetical protein
VAFTGENRGQRFFYALLIGGLAGAVVGLCIKLILNPESGGGGETKGKPTTEDTEVASVVRDSVAWQYANAYQEGDWARVVDLTLWMDERMAFVAERGTVAEVAEEREALIEDISCRSIDDNNLRDAGVADQYIFIPGARLEYVTDDEGRSDLAAEVARRTWFNVVYPSREKALLDREGLPIRSLYAGVNVSVAGRVLKAGVIGNLDIDWDSIKYDWPP